MELKRLENDLKCLTVIITSKKKSKDYYQIVKQELGGRLALATQVITTETIQATNDPKVKKNAKEYIYMNILLQIYAKSGIQPWLLSEELHSDCFIGLDKSREEGKHAAGLVQVVGKDGRI
ncbi:MAG: stem cell self-renewal protein Piwi domain-containing protein, partial [Planifilum fulgidum]